MELMAWTDERLSERFDRVDERLDDVKREVSELRRDVKQEMGELRHEVLVLHRGIHRIGGGVIIALIGVIGAILANG